jgi:uncharacterized protein
VVRPALRLFSAAVLLAFIPACFQAETTERQVAQSQSVCNLVPTNGMPKMAGRVTDAAGILSADETQILTDLSAKVEAETKVQMAFVTVPSIGEANEADYTCTLANLWGIGDKDRNDGVVILISMEPKRLRIGVGRGLEERLTAERVNPVVDAMRFHFKSRDFGKGLEAGGKGVYSLLRAD